ncbi:anaerobic nitric oxide reductase flavorubredoxin [Segatella paludivivens]|uniref:anaerobic nitric oxide reductase flavorubredoxin n=1 Tax=Segatella paludivivens TaxID=185294 RepID=UPI00038161EF|nr:anaerobic nitric oxide reductase flavorubredoxin [Segatella paludivivens]
MAKQITNKVSWVGKIDWELTKFHGDELSTMHGSSYNAYLIQDEKTALIDTVWQPYDKEFVARLKKTIDLKKIDYIVMNHNEIDHSGALVELMREIPGTPIYCTKKGESIIRGHYHPQDWNFVNVKTGDTLNLGQNTLTFIEAPMLHWPDTMFSYLSGENILFSNDAFGQHFATESLYNDTVKQDDLMWEAQKYYANIINPFSMMVSRKVKELIGMNLTIKMICPSHGIIWKDNPKQIIDKYIDWCNEYKENQITIIYDTMWQSTRKMGEAIADGIQEVDKDVTVKLFNASQIDKNDILTEIFQSKAILVGSPTINNGYSYAIAGILEMARGIKYKGKKAAAFGSYGWNGDAPKMITAHLQEAGFEIVNDGIKKQWVPDVKDLDDCTEYGKEFAKATK